MTNRIRDEQYLCVSAYVRALESDLLTAGDLERMIGAGTVEDALRILTEHGYPRIDPSMPALEQALRRANEQLFAGLEPLLPRQELLELFRIGYDIHNVKTALKAQWTGTDGTGLLLEGGQLEKQALYRLLQTGEDRELPPYLAEVVREARETVGATGDPRRGDLLLDRALYARMGELAENLSCDFFTGYVSLLADSTNLQTVVRVLRMGKNTLLLREALLEGGTVETDALIAAAQAGEVVAPWLAGPLEGAALLGKQALEGDGLTALEKACDNARMAYLRSAALIPFGPGPVLAYLAAREQEGRSIRIVISGKLLGLAADTIRERMGDTYG